MELDTTSPRHPMIDQLWNLSDEEYKKFYRGCGRATLVIDEENSIIKCHYSEMADAFQPDDEQARDTADIIPLTRQRVLIGMFSGGQFMTDKKTAG